MSTGQGNPPTSENRALIVVAKRPAPGQTKTRLCPPLLPTQAAALYEAFLLDTLAAVRRTAGILPVIAYLPPGARDYFASLAPDFEHILQEGDGLGERLDFCLSHYLRRGSTSAVIMNSDTPTLPAAYLAQAFEILEAGADVVLGPCSDGGYYLIGLKQPAPRLLKEVRMSTPTVLQDTLALAKAAGLQTGLLPAWYDIDDAASLSQLVEDLKTCPPGAGDHTRRLLQSSSWQPHP